MPIWNWKIHWKKYFLGYITYYQKYITREKYTTANCWFSPYLNLSKSISGGVILIFLTHSYRWKLPLYIHVSNYFFGKWPGYLIDDTRDPPSRVFQPFSVLCIIYLNGCSRPTRAVLLNAHAYMYEDLPEGAGLEEIWPQAKDQIRSSHSFSFFIGAIDVCFFSFCVYY